MMKLKSFKGFLRILLTFVIFSSCIFKETNVKPLDKEGISYSHDFLIESPTKAHLLNGSLVVYPKGFSVRNNILVGQGRKYDLLRQTNRPVLKVSLDSVASLEYYLKEFQGDYFLSTLPTAIVGGGVIFKAIFGSCPTIYSFDGENYSLEAEAFSYSITKRYEADDLDRLDSGKLIDGEYSLRVANEALETHYINHLSLITVDHPQGLEAFPKDRHDVVLFGKQSKIINARNKLGADVLRFISSRDDQFYQTDSLVTHTLTSQIVQDWIDVNVKIPPNATKMTVAFRLRNTLLNTVLLYDVMLASQGIKAIDWLGSETSNLFYAWRFSKWYEKHFGLRIQLYDGNKYIDMVRIADTGPIAWHQQAVELPVPTGDVARLRINFLPDNWLIDWIAVSFDENKNYQLASNDCIEITDFRGEPNDNYIEQIREKDDHYQVTYPGESYILKFRPEPVQEGMIRSYFLESRGFYIEWLRQEWLKKNITRANDLKFELNDETIMKTAQLWLKKKHRFEEDFYQLKIPTQRGK